MEALLGVLIGLALYRIFNDRSQLHERLERIDKPVPSKPAVIVHKKVVVKVEKEDLALLGVLVIGLAALSFVSSKRVTNNTTQKSSRTDVSKHLAERQSNNANNQN